MGWIEIDSMPLRDYLISTERRRSAQVIIDELKILDDLKFLDEPVRTHANGRVLKAKTVDGVRYELRYEERGKDRRRFYLLFRDDKPDKRGWQPNPRLYEIDLQMAGRPRKNGRGIYSDNSSFGVF